MKGKAHGLKIDYIGLGLLAPWASETLQVVLDKGQQ